MRQPLVVNAAQLGIPEIVNLWFEIKLTLEPEIWEEIGAGSAESFVVKQNPNIWRRSLRT